VVSPVTPVTASKKVPPLLAGPGDGERPPGGATFPPWADARSLYRGLGHRLHHVAHHDKFLPAPDFVRDQDQTPRRRPQRLDHHSQVKNHF